MRIIQVSLNIRGLGRTHDELSFGLPALAMALLVVAQVWMLVVVALPQ